MVTIYRSILCYINKLYKKKKQDKHYHKEEYA